MSVFDREAVRLTRRQMAEVFDTSPENVPMHLRDVFAGGELEAEATTKEFLAVRTEGRRRVRSPPDTLQPSTPSSRSATGSTRGGAYASANGPPARSAPSGARLRGQVNERRLAERGLREAREILDLPGRTLRNQTLVDDTGQAAPEIVTACADTRACCWSTARTACRRRPEPGRRSACWITTEPPARSRSSNAS